MILSTSLTILRSYVLVVDDTVDGKDNQEKDIMEVGDIMMYHFNQNNLAQLPLADIRLLLLPHVDVMNIGVVTQFEAVKHF